MFKEKEALLIDMNSTFMFGEDRFGEEENFSQYYQSIGGKYPSGCVNSLIRKVYSYLDEKYPSEEYRHCFPCLEEAIDACLDQKLEQSEKEKVINTFSYHEHGEVPEIYAQCLKRLSKRFILSLVIDIWAPKNMWVNTFQRLGIWELFSAHSFSSDHGMIKPSPKPFELVVDKLGVPKGKCLVIGDSIRRDLGGAVAAGLDCVLVGGAMSEEAVGSFPTLLDFQKLVA